MGGRRDVAVVVALRVAPQRDAAEREGGEREGGHARSRRRSRRCATRRGRAGRAGRVGRARAGWWRSWGLRGTRFRVDHTVPAAQPSDDPRQQASATAWFTPVIGALPAPPPRRPRRRRPAAMIARITTVSATAIALTHAGVPSPGAMPAPGGRLGQLQDLARRVGARGRARGCRAGPRRGSPARRSRPSGASATARPPRAACPAAARPRPGCARRRPSRAGPRRTAGGSCARARGARTPAAAPRSACDQRDAAAPAEPLPVLVPRRAGGADEH